MTGVTVGSDGVARCWWAATDPLYREYHDGEWGRPVSDDPRLFEKLSLESFMSGLSWLTILRKRERFRVAFAGFEPEAIAEFTDDDVDRLMRDPGIVRNRAKILATIHNARRLRELEAEYGSMAAYVWSFEPPPRQARLDWAALTAEKFGPEAAAMSKDLRQRGWSFVGPTTVHSFMEAMGLINDHLDDCDLKAVIEAERRAFKRPTKESPPAQTKSP
jgi:DNA-3-methyladenine glycosylase I